MKLLYTLVFFVILAGCSAPDKPENCSDFKDGKFIEEYGDTLHISIERHGEQQVETSELGISHYKITWISECEYESQLQETTIDYAQKWIGKKYKIIIMSTNKTGYVYSCQKEGTDFIVEGSVKKVE